MTRISCDCLFLTNFSATLAEKIMLENVNIKNSVQLVGMFIKLLVASVLDVLLHFKKILTFCFQ